VTSAAAPGLLRGLYERFEHLIRELAKFGIVGLLALVVDIGLFNYLRYVGPAHHGSLYDKPLTAKAISVAVATTCAYFGNRHWTFRHRERLGFMREYGMFIVLNVLAMAIALISLWISHYVLKLTSPLADNVSANVIGLGIGTMFRFWSYRKWVFTVPNGVPDQVG
jgi:putative flippase GtrA